MGLAAGVVGAGLMGFSDTGVGSNDNPALRAVAYLGASGAVLGWIVGTTAALPFHGRSVIGPNDVRNASITGGVVGLLAGVATGSLMGFKCSNGCASPMMTIGVAGLVGTGLGTAIGHSVGVSLPH